MFNLLLDFVFPRFCLGCNEEGKDLCDVCFGRLGVSEQICPMCLKPSAGGFCHTQCRKKRGMEGLTVIFDYDDEVVRGMLDEIKFGFNKELMRSVAERVWFESGERFDFVVPLPLHFYRENWRGFNQSRVLAEEIGKSLNCDVLDLLVRTRRTKQQSSIVSVGERELNVKGAFELGKGKAKQAKGAKVLLVDDIFTSGADMRECAGVMKTAGVDVVWGLALAH